MNMVSDGGSVDWGFLLTVYGVMEEPTPAEVKRYEEQVDSSVLAQY